MTVTVYKAQPIRSDKDDVPELAIRAVSALPTFEDAANGQEEMAADARRIADALLGSLPGGTIDALLRLLLEHRASKLTVRWPR